MTKTRKKRWARRIKRILFLLLILVLVILGIVYLITYYYANDLAKDYLIKAIHTGSKGIYTAQIRSLRIEPLTGRITVNGFRLIPDTALYTKKSRTDTLAPMLIGMTIRKFQVRNWDIRKTLLNKELYIGKILVDKPDVTVFLKRKSEKKEKKEPNPRMLSIPLPKGWNSLKVDLIALNKGKILIIDQTKSPADSFSIPSVDIRIRKILVDSVHQGLHRIFNADDIKMSVSKLTIKTKNRMYTIQLGEVGFSTQKNHLWVKEFRLKPEYSYYDFSRKLGYQMDRIDVSIRKLDLFRIDFRRMVIYRQLIAGHVLVDGLSVDDYRDKRVPIRTDFFPLLPHQALMKSDMYIRLDSVEMTNGYIKYSEQTGNEPGFLFFDKATGLVTNVTNDTSLLLPPKKMKVEGTMYLMGKGQLQAAVEFLLGSKNDQFIFSGTLGQFDMTLVNPMLTKLTPARITSGTITKLIIPPVKADNDKATGQVKLYYKNLTIEMESKKKDNWSKIKSGVIGWAANVYVKNSNPMPNGKFRDGIIYFERDKRKSLFNFLWKSAFFGLKSTMGINTEKQKEIKKAKSGKK